MGVVTSDILALTAAGLKVEFDAAYNAAQSAAVWQRVASDIPTTLPIQSYGFLGRGAVMEELKDRAREQQVNQFNYSLTDKTYKGRLSIDRRTLEDDQYGLLMKRVRALGVEPVRHWNKLAYTGLALGATTLCYDGQYFVDTDHSEGDSGTQSNKSTTALSDTQLQLAEAAMMGFVDDKGECMEIMPDTLVVGPKLARFASDLLESSVIVKEPGDGAIASGATTYTPRDNYFKGKYALVVSPYLSGTYDDYWFLLDTSREIKPIVIQSRSDVPITIETDMEEPSAKMKEKFSFDARGRYVQGYGLWQTCFAGIL
jgi:phage major head subunit gpT-like protein